MSTDDHIIIRESLEKLKRAHPELDSVTKILSRYPVSENGEGGFIRDFADELGGIREARQVYRMVANIQEKAALMWANIRDVASPHFSQALFNNLPDDFLQQLQSIPSYIRLFGGLDYLECDHCRSIFGPAAYFVDLMRFVETNITSKNNNITSECELEYRRPDLYEMQLNYSNTNDLIPYIDLVNELLEVFIKNEATAKKDAYELVEDVAFPKSLPFNLPLEEIRSYLKQSGTSLYRIYKAFDNLNDANTKSLTAREFLELSPKEFSFIISEISSPPDILKYYGDLPLRGKTGLENVDLFLEQTKLTRQELNELIFQDLDRHELNAGLSRLFFVNNVDDGLGPLGISQDGKGLEELLNLSPKKLDRIYRFVKLSRKLGWSFTDLDWSLRSLQEPYIPEGGDGEGYQFNGKDQYLTAQEVEYGEIDQMTLEAWVKISGFRHNNFIISYGGGTKRPKFALLVGAAGKLNFVIGNKQYRSSKPIPSNQLTHVCIIVLKPQGSDQYEPNLYINGTLDGDLSAVPKFNFGLTPHNLNIGRSPNNKYYFKGIIKEVRLWNRAHDNDQIGRYMSGPVPSDESGLIGYWRLDEVEDGIAKDLSCNQNDLYLIQRKTLDADALEGIAAIKSLKEGHRWSVDRLCALWYSIKHFGKEDQTALFDKVFNPEESGIERWDCYLDQPIRWDKTGEEDRGRDRKIRSRLMGALRVSHDDLNAIVEHLSGEDEKIIELDHLYLNQMYRLAQLAGILHLGVRDLLELLSLVEKSTPDTPQEVVELEELVQWMKSCGLKVGDLVSITYDLDDPDDLGGRVSFFKEADVLDLAYDLIGQAGDLLIKRDSFKADHISQAESAEVFNFLRGEGLVNEIINEKGDVIGAAVTPKSSETVDFEDLLKGLAEGHNWISEFDVVKSEFDKIELDNTNKGKRKQIEPTLGDNIIEGLKKHGYIDSNGFVFYKEEGEDYDTERLKDCLKGANYSQEILDEAQKNIYMIIDVLKLRKDIQKEILDKEGPVHTALQKARDDQRNAVITGVASLFDVQPDLTSVVFDYFCGMDGKDKMDASKMLSELNAVHESRSVSDDLAAYLAKLSKVLHLADLLGLSVAEVEALLEDPEIFSLSDVLRPTLQELHDLFGFKQLQAAFEDADGKLIELLRLNAVDADGNSVDLLSPDAVNADAILKAIDDLAGWEPRQVKSLVQHFGSIQYNRIPGLSRMKACFDLARSLQVDIDFMIQLADTSLLGTDEEFRFYSQKAALLLDVLRAKYTDEEWPKVYKPIRDHLAVQRRDALLSLAMLKLGLAPDYKGRRDPDIFHQYFLLDFQVGSEVETSRIVQGAASLQLYVQRCLMNLERGVDPATIPTEEWEWVKNYRVWEANRKVFLYPENYIEPELRDTKSPIFEELEQELLQSEITQGSAEAAFAHYLEKFAEVADLKIVGSYLYTDVTDKRSANPAERDEVLYLVGRTSTDPKIYYLREHVKDEFGARWLPWKKIDLVINSDFVTPVYAFGKLFLFWTEFTKFKKSVGGKLSDRILSLYGVDILSRVVTASEGEMDDLDTLKTKVLSLKNYAEDSYFRDEFSEQERKDLFEKISSLRRYINEIRDISSECDKFEGYWAENLGENLSGDEFKEFYDDLADFDRTISQYLCAKRELEAELEEAIISKLKDGTWRIDEEGYLLNAETDQMVQETMDVYTTAVKYSYLNFSNGWIQPQTYFDNELTESMYREPRWQRVYAQQVLELKPKEGGQPKKEKNVKVLRIDGSTWLNKVIPKFDMSELTWEFWTKFINTKPSGWKDSIKRRDVQKSVELIDYDNFNITATNKITISRAYNAAQEIKKLIETAEDHVVKEKYLDAEESATQAKNQASKSGFVDSARVADLAEEAALSFSPAMNKKSEASAARQKANGVQQKANKAQWETRADEARNKAESARLSAENAWKNGDEQNASLFIDQALTFEDEAMKLEGKLLNLKDLNGKAAKLEDEANSLKSEALTKVRDALAAAGNAVSKTPKWISNAVTLTVQLGESTLPTDLDYNVWQHIAIIFEDNNGNYNVTLHKDGAEMPVQGSLTGVQLPSHELLVIGNRNKADFKGAFIAQMSDFRLWDHVRDIEAIKNESNYRKTGEEEGLLFYLPLNDEKDGFVKSRGFNFKTPVFKGELLKRIDERERIILFYGDQVASLRNNLKGNSLNLALESTHTPIYDVKLSYYRDSDNPYDLLKAGLHLTKTKGLSINDFATGEDETVLARPAVLPTTDVDQQEWLLENLEGTESSFADVNNQPGWYIADVGDEQFLVKAVFSDSDGDPLPMPTMAEISTVNYGAADRLSSSLPLSISYNLKDGDALFVSENTTKSFKFERLNTFAVHELSENLFTGGINKLLSLESQSAKELDFEREYKPDTWTPGKELVPGFRNISKEIDFQGAYRLYFEEIFFHVPFLIANKLNSNQNFADSQRWYHYIFNPTASAGGEKDDRDRYWRYRPFRGRGLDSLFDLLTNGEALSAYREDPFDPHAIAALRLNSYQKAVVMKYIDNLLDWGDSLFMQSMRESTTEALMLYVLAYDLLGPRPKSKTIKRFEEMGTYKEFINEYEGCKLDEIPEFFTEIEKKNSDCATTVPHSNIIADFCVPENAMFIGYWDRVEDRLFKIRHSLNIEGIFRQLALFEPPIEPMELVRAIAGGASISGALSALNVAVPHYRYSFMLGAAKDMTSNVMELGSALLGAIESRDAEELAILQNTHERAILNLTTSIKEKEIELAQEAIEALEISKRSPEYKIDWYQQRIDEYMNDEEKHEQNLIISGMVIKNVGATLKAVGAAVSGSPEITVGGGGAACSPIAITTTGGKSWSGPAIHGGEALEIAADILNTSASLTAKKGEYKRREAGWKFEKSLAEKELDEIDQQIAAAQIQLAIAKQELAVHSKTIQQNQEIEQFYRSKFSNQALYSWMVGRLSGLYFQAYKLAYDMAKSAEKALQYELPTNETYITPGHWDSLKKGLLAGESLMLELNRMEKSHLDQDSRFQEIEKTISMNRTFPGSLFLLAASGACEFRLSEELFDMDYPGHYFRVIKSLEIEVKTSKQLEPYESVNATLIQLGSKALIDPDIGGVRYLMGLDSEQPTSNTLRVNWRANQQVAISRINEKDDGMFILDFFFDDRYFPFEGTGAVSSWRLEIPKENNPDLVQDNVLQIEDVLIHLRYTSKYDRGAFRKEVGGLLRDLKGA